MTEAEGSLMATYRPAPVRFVRGDGARLFDDEGHSYLDFLCGIAVTSLGHAHPAVRDALCRQAGELWHVSNLFHNALAQEVASAIDHLVGDGQPAGGKVFFANSGAEANECAIKLARRFAGEGRYAVISADGSFHGRTLATLAATGQPAKQAPFAPMPVGFAQVPYGDLRALERLLVACPEVAAVLLEPIQGEGGIVDPPAGYLRAVRELCDAHGALLVLDEIQTGLGRTGRWFAFQHDGVVPDIVTVAKALGNGAPVGACWARANVAKAFVPGDHGSTFGGQPLVLSAVRATLSTMVELDAPRLASEAGVDLRTRLAALSGVVGLRGRGLLVGVELEEGIDASEVAAQALRTGLVVNSPVAGVLRLTPPLVVSAAERCEAVSILELALDAVRGARGAAGDSYRPGALSSAPLPAPPGRAR